MCNLTNLINRCEEDNLPGIKQKIYACPASEFNGWPDVDTDGVTLTEAFSFTGAGTGKGYWRAVEVQMDSASVSAKASGEVGSIMPSVTFPFFVNGFDTDAKAWAHENKNCCLVFLVPDRSGVYHVIGHPDDPAHLTEFDGGTGAKQGDKRGIMYTATWNAGKMPYSYDAATLGIDTTPI